MNNLSLMTQWNEDIFNFINVNACEEIFHAAIIAYRDFVNSTEIREGDVPCVGGILEQTADAFGDQADLISELDKAYAHYLHHLEPERFREPGTEIDWNFSEIETGIPPETAAFLYENYHAFISMDYISEVESIYTSMNIVYLNQLNQIINSPICEVW